MAFPWSASVRFAASISIIARLRDNHPNRRRFISRTDSSHFHFARLHTEESLDAFRRFISRAPLSPSREASFLPLYLFRAAFLSRQRSALLVRASSSLHGIFAPSRCTEARKTRGSDYAKILDRREGWSFSCSFRILKRIYVRNPYGRRRIHVLMDFKY